MKSLAEIKTILQGQKKDLFKKYRIKSLAIFGSVARNENSAISDLDLLVEFNENIGIRFIDLANQIERAVDLKTDLVSRNAIKERYYEQIKDELIYV